MSAPSIKSIVMGSSGGTTSAPLINLVNLFNFGMPRCVSAARLIFLIIWSPAWGPGSRMSNTPGSALCRSALRSSALRGGTPGGALGGTLSDTSGSAPAPGTGRLDPRIFFMRIFCQILHGRGSLFFRLLAALVFDVTKFPRWIIIRMRHLSVCIVLFIHGLPERVSVWVWHALVGAGRPGWQGLLRVLAATKRRPWRIIAVYRSAFFLMHLVN